MPSNHDASRIVDVWGIAPCIKENHGTVTAIVDDLYANREPRVYKDYAPSLRAERFGLKAIELPATLKYQRTEYAKKIRKDYEAGKIKERRCNMREYTVRNDGCTNTLTTVLKDNYLVVEDKRND